MPGGKKRCARKPTVRPELGVPGAEGFAVHLSNGAGSTACPWPSRQRRDRCNRPERREIPFELVIDHTAGFQLRQVQNIVQEGEKDFAAVTEVVEVVADFLQVPSFQPLRREF